MDKKKRSRSKAFPESLPRSVKRTVGRTAAEQTPLNLRASGVAVDDRTAAYVRHRLGRQLHKFAPHIQRVTVRVEDVNGPRGGVDKVCRVKVVLSGLPTVVLEDRARRLREAIDRSADRVERAVRRTVEQERKKSFRGTPRARAATRAAPAKRKAPSAGAEQRPENGSLIGARVGRSLANLKRAAARPEKQRRDVPVDTAAPGMSASDRRAGGGSTAARNTKLNVARMTAALEDSAQSRPSRKSTRKSANRSKRDSNLRRKEIRAARSPSARAARTAAKSSDKSSKSK